MSASKTLPRALTIVSVLLACVVPLASCSKFSSEANKEEHRRRALAYFEKGQLEEAIIEFKNVIQIDPKNADGHYRLALTYLKLDAVRNIQAAYEELLKTVELDAANQDAQLKLGALYLVSQQPDKARERADVVLASAPQDIPALILRGQSFISAKQFAKGIAELKGAIELDPKRVSTYVTLAQAYLQMKDVPAAEEALGQAQKADPQSADAREAMGDFRYLIGKPHEAEAEYKRALELAGDNDALHLKLALKLAGFYQATRKWDQTEAVYQRLAERKPTDEKPHVLLGDFYVFTGRTEKAWASYQRALDIDPSSAAARDKLIESYLNAGKWEEAEKRIQPILEKNPRDLSGRFFDARLRLGRGKADEAIELLHAVIREKPQFASPHYVLGLVSLQQNDLPQARRELTDAVKFAPNSGEARTALAALYLGEGSYQLAIEQAQAALLVNGRNLQAATILGDAYLGQGDIDKAMRTFQSISKALPKEAYSRYRLGLIERSLKHDVLALAYFEESLVANPDAIEPLTQIATIRLKQGDQKEALDRVSHQLKMSPRNPLIYNLLGELWMQRKHANQAEAAFKQAIELNPRLLVSYMNLGNLYLATGKQERAITEYEAALVKNPKLLVAHMGLGMIYEQRKEYDKAKAQYEEVLKLNPSFSPAANNLAWILSEQGGTLDLALSYAETARKHAPNDPNIADTLGWISYKTHADLKARSLLKEATEKLPDNPVVLYHYGLAQQRNGDVGGAKKSLQTALRLSQAFPGAEKAKQVLQELSISPLSSSEVVSP